VGHTLVDSEGPTAVVFGGGDDCVSCVLLLDICSSSLGLLDDDKAVRSGNSGGSTPTIGPGDPNAKKNYCSQQADQAGGWPGRKSLDDVGCPVLGLKL